MKKYAVYSGHVISRSDGERHYIPAHRVAELYNVNPKECMFLRQVDGRPRGMVQGLISLRPRNDGDYDLPHRLRLNNTS